MESFLLSSLYYQCLHVWYQKHRDSEDYFHLADFQTTISSLCVAILKQHPYNTIVLIASDGRVTHVSTMNDPAPDTFKTRRYMKVDNRSSLITISTVLTYLFQLLSIDTEDQKLSILDAIGLVQFVIWLLLENEIDASEWSKMVRNHLFRVPPFIGDKTLVWKEVRNQVLKTFLDKEQRTEPDGVNEAFVQQMESMQSLVTDLRSMVMLQREDNHQMMSTMKNLFMEQQAQLEQTEENMTQLEDAFHQQDKIHYDAEKEIERRLFALSQENVRLTQSVQDLQTQLEDQVKRFNLEKGEWERDKIKSNHRIEQMEQFLSQWKDHFIKGVEPEADETQIMGLDGYDVFSIGDGS